MKTVMAFDFGTQFIGVAAAQSQLSTPTRLSAVKAKDGIPNWSDIEKHIREWQPRLLIVGLPLNSDGSESDMSLRAAKFSRRLQHQFGIEVATIDETLSSREAKSRLRDAGKTQKFKQLAVDSEAAAIILETWLNSNTSAD